MSEKIKDILDRVCSFTYYGWITRREGEQIRDNINDLQQKIEYLEKRNKEIYDGFLAVSNERCEYYAKWEQLENIRKEAIGYVTSYESISTIQGLDDIEKNKNLDEKTMNEMVNRYLKVHDILLNILNKESDKE